MSGRTRRRRRSQTLLLFLLLAGGCMPHVLHSPRVEPGGSGSISGSLGRNAAIGDRGDGFFPSLYGGIRRGFVSRDSSAALLIGAQASPFALFYALDGEGTMEDLVEAVGATSYLDVYAQPPRARGVRWDWGAGALASTAMLAPYVQLGHRRADGDGWFTTQMVAFASEPYNESVLWLPSVGWRMRGGSQSTEAVMIDLSGAVRLDGATDRDWFLFLTFTAELGLAQGVSK